MDKHACNIEVPKDITNQLRVKIAYKINSFFIYHAFKGSRKMRTMISNLLVPAPKGISLVRTVHGFEMLVNPVAGRLIEKSIYFTGTYESGTLNIMQCCLEPGDTFIDVGASIGVMSLFASNIVGTKGKVYSFEPEPRNFDILKQNTHRNNINNVTAVNTALGSMRGKSTLYAYRGEGKRQSPSLIPTEAASYKVEVLVQPLDEFVKSNNITKVKMMKIDVEGWELEVLKGSKVLLSGPEAPVVVVEYSTYHPVHKGSLLEIYNYIRNVNDYQIFKLKKGKSNISPLHAVKTASDLPEHDNLFCLLPNHLERIKNNIKII